MSPSPESNPIEFRAVSVEGWQESGTTPRFGLRFRVTYCPAGELSAGVLKHDFTELAFNGFYHGLVTPIGTVDISRTTTNAPGTVHYVSELNASALDTIDKLRDKAGYLELSLLVCGSIEQDGMQHAVEARITYPVTDDEWAACRKQMGHDR